MDAVSKVYAEALFDLAKDTHAIKVYQEDMLKVQEVFNDASLVQFFSHVALSDEIKNDVMKKAFEGQIQDYIYNFLLLLIKKRRINVIVGICQEFQQLCNDYQGIKVGKIYSAYELSQDDITKIEKAMSQKENKKVKLDVVIDSRLMGGIKVDINNHVYDDTLSNKLESLKQELLRK